MFTMSDTDFSTKGIEDFNKAVLCGDTISDRVWQFVYYNDIIEVIDTVEHFEKAGRWEYPVDVIFELEGKYFCFSYYRGLTECQENEFYDMVAIPVHKVTKTIIAEEWESIEDN